MAVIRITPESSNIAEYTYDDQKRLMVVTFVNGWRYTFANVPDEAFQNMRKYRSAGEFFKGVIQRNYEMVRKEAPRDEGNEGAAS
jgi:KTSC domain-containing protein